MQLPLGERCLLELLQAEDAGDARDILRVLRAQDRDADILEIARRHRLSPALYYCLRVWVGDLPDLPWEALKADYFLTAAKNTLLYRELARVLEALQSRDIRGALLKGAVLAETVYDNVALRPMGDIDLLVPKGQVPEARKTMVSLGYTPLLTTEARPGLSEEYENELAFTHPDEHMVVEIHWNLLDAPYYQQHIPQESLWAEAMSLCVDRHSVEALAPEAMLVHLAAHWILHHGGHSLRWLYDIDQSIRRLGDSIDWPKALQLSREWDLVMPLQMATRRCIDDASTPLPEGVAEKVFALVPRARERRVFAYLTSPRRDVITRFIRDLVMIQGMSRKARYLVSNILPSGEYMHRRYSVPPGRMLWPYYGLRLWKGIWQLAGAAIGRAPRK